MNIAEIIVDKHAREQALGNAVCPGIVELIMLTLCLDLLVNNCGLCRLDMLDAWKPWVRKRENRWGPSKQTTVELEQLKHDYPVPLAPLIEKTKGGLDYYTFGAPKL